MFPKIFLQSYSVYVQTVSLTHSNALENMSMTVIRSCLVTPEKSVLVYFYIIEKIQLIDMVQWIWLKNV